jgi:putative ABC transport system permease protein
LWQRRFGGRADILGRAVMMNEQPRRVVGVMPAGFAFPTPDTSFWIPNAPTEDQRNSRGSLWLQAIGRLEPGATVAQAQDELARINASIQERYPNEKGFGVNTVSYRDQMVGRIRPAILVLLAAVAFVLLIACANVASLLLARASTREREIALRTAIGAGRLRLLRQLLTESLVLGVIGGGLGLLLARFGLASLLAIAPDDLPRASEIGMDAGVLVFAIALSILTGLVFGLAPAVQILRSDPATGLREGGRSVTGSGLRLRRALVVAEVAVAVVLLVGAGLMLRSFQVLLDVDLGMRPEGVLVSRISLDRARYGGDAASSEDSRLPLPVELYRRLIERVEALPGVEGAAGITSVFLSATPNSTIFMIEGRPAPPPEERVEVPIDVVTDGYFDVMKIPLVAGRFFDSREVASPDAQKSVIINETLARRFFPNEDPLGKRIRYGDGSSPQAPWMTIVGVVGDTRRTGFDSAVRAETYLPHAQAPARTMEFLVRTGRDPMTIVPDLRAILRSLDPEVPLQSPRPLVDVVGEMTAQRRLNTLLLTIFAALAVLITAVGIYGVVAYSVERRTRELGVRAALGAAAADTVRLVLVEGLTLVGIGLVIGLAAAAGLARVMTSLLYGVSASDPAAFAVSAAAAIVTAVLACVVPAMRAASVDPVAALRAE